MMSPTYNLNHLKLLEDESCQIILDAYRQFERPVLLYSIGKDSSVMVRWRKRLFIPVVSRLNCCILIRHGNSKRC